VRCVVIIYIFIVGEQMIWWKSARVFSCHFPCPRKTCKGNRCIAAVILNLVTAWRQLDAVVAYSRGLTLLLEWKAGRVP
jgi:hypothetical protein